MTEGGKFISKSEARKRGFFALTFFYIDLSRRNDHVIAFDEPT
jgi:hypothetical protein